VTLDVQENGTQGKPERVAIIGSRAKYWPHTDVIFARDAVIAIVGGLPADATVISHAHPVRGDSHVHSGT